MHLKPLLAMLVLAMLGVDGAIAQPKSDGVPLPARAFLRIGSDKLLVNTGTWMKMINLNLQYLGQDSGLTYALIEYDDSGSPLVRLMRWHGTRTLCETIPAAY